MNLTPFLIVTAVLFAGLVLAGPPSARQNAAPEATVKAVAGPAPTSAELYEFAEAVVATGDIRRAARPGIVHAPTPAARTRLEQAASREIKAAIRSKHLSLHRYLQIVAFTNAHPAEQKKFVALMKELPIPPPPDCQP